jgi:hypothetical protein
MNVKIGNESHGTPKISNAKVPAYRRRANFKLNPNLKRDAEASSA